MQFSIPEILADSSEDLSPKKRSSLKYIAIAIAILILAALSALAFFLSRSDAPKQGAIEENLPRPRALILDDAHRQPYVHNDKVRSGDTIYTIFKRLSIDDPEALKHLTNTEEGKQTIRHLRADRHMTALVNSDGSLVMLTLPVTKSRSSTGQIVLERDANDMIRFRSDEEAIPVNTTIEMGTGIIQHSLFGAADRIGLPDGITMKLADLFGTKINFHTELRRGDQFSVIYEMVHEQGIPARTGRILAAEFINRGKRYAVVLYKPSDRAEQHFTEEGTNLGQSFLRSPLEFSRMSSGFGKRIHPIHKTWRNHSGVDFAAPTGTPVKAASDGTVSFVGVQGGYGNVVFIKHRGVYSTGYAHLSRFAKGLKKGMQVSQGDIIAYVGSTGVATGPHLHYEIRVKGVPHDPMKIDLPPPEPLSPEELTKFKKIATPLLDRIAALKYIPSTTPEDTIESTAEAAAEAPEETKTN